MQPDPDTQGNTVSPLTVTAGDIQLLGSLVSSTGISFEQILNKLKLSSDLLNSPTTSTVRLADYFRILEQLSVATHDETCHLSSRPLMPGTTHFVLSNLSECASLYEAMKLMAKSYNVLHGGQYNRVERRDDFLVYIIDDDQFPYVLDYNSQHIHFTMECVLIFLHGMLSFITTDHLSSKLTKIYSKRAQRASSSQHLAFWDVPIRFKCSSYALFYDISAASIPITFSTDDLPSAKTIYHKVITMVEEKQRVEYRNRDASSLVREALEEGLHDQKNIAGKLSLSIATLRRRLSQENTNFRQLRNQILNETAKSLLEQHHHVGDIAEELGFSDFRSFIRAFKNWNGVTPRTYVNNLSKDS